MRLCITGGGTGGHLMIAQALVQAAVSNGHEVIFIGSTYGQDQNYFAKNSSFKDVYFLDTTGVVNKKGMDKLKALYKIYKAYKQSKDILKKHKIQATYSVGGFSAAPASFASISSFIPFFIHEQNAVAGKLNSILKPFAKRFISAYDEKSPIKSYPVKDIFFNSSRVRYKIESVIFLGGSHGAKAINDLALDLADELSSRGIKIIHQAGENDFSRVEEAYKDMGIDVELYSFTDKLSELIAKADFAVSRAGASTLWELTANGCPALFIPYPYAAGDHQYHNAEFVVKNEMGWCEREDEDLKSKFLEILDDSKYIAQKSKKLLSFAKKDVASKMIKDIESFVK